MSTSIDGSLISSAFTSNSVARRWEWNHTGPDNTRLAVPVPVPREGIPERHQVDTLVTDDPQAPPLNIRSSFTSPHLRLVASCRNYFSRGRRALRGFSRPTSPTLDDNKQDYIIEHESFHSVNMASGVPMSLPLRRSVSSPCLVDQSRDTFAETETSSKTITIDSVPLMPTPPAMPSKKTLKVNPVSGKSRPRSHHASTKSFSLRSGPFAKTDFFSLQRAVPNELTSDKRRSCSMGDDLHLGSQQQQVVGVIQPIAATMAPEILSWIFRHLMDRKSILNCSLVCRRWYGPAREELAHLLRDMPYNGQGLIQAIRTRFVSETLSTLSVFVFDKLLWNLAEVYYYSNPDTKAIFAPQYPPDMLYHLFWTFLFVDQEFRNPRTKSKVNSAYYIRLLQGEGCGYPKQHFHKKVFKSLQALGDGHGGLGGATASSSLFMRFSGSLRIDDSLRRIRRWWRSMREIGSQINSAPALEGSGSSTSTINAMTRVSNFSNGDYLIQKT
ncbi:hypothetical protein BGW42_000083 [Actinomortierella wolfii]|nr:hypothetical protein BGW42_000083 [Actinomortierella wolfii]